MAGYVYDICEESSFSTSPEDETKLHTIDASFDPDVAVLVPRSAVTGEVVTRMGLK
jgi:hypothetical protein